MTKVRSMFSRLLFAAALLGSAAIVAGTATSCADDDAAATPAPATTTPATSAPATSAPATSAPATTAPATSAPSSTATRPPAQATSTPGAPVKLTGNIEIDGSSTVFPISQAVAEEFRRTNTGVQIPVGISGTGGGFQRFTRGEIDISDASRTIKQAEIDAAKAAGIEYVELAVAFDGLSVVVPTSNTWATCMTTAELKKLWDQGSTVEKWNQIRPEWPDKEINLYGPGTDSGTFDTFTELINGTAKKSRADYNASEDDNQLVQGVSGDDYGLGYFGYAYYAENTSLLKVVAIDAGAGAGCITPSSKTIEDGTYKPLSRLLYIYVKKTSLARPEVRAFVEYYIKNAAVLSTEVGYVALPAAMYEAGLEKIK